MNFLDCYAEFDPQTGLLAVGNSRTRREMQLEGGGLRTLRLLDAQNGTEWAGDARPIRPPVLREGERPAASLAAGPRSRHGMAPHLLASLALSGSSGTVWHEFLLFPGISFLFYQIRVEKTGEPAGEVRHGEEAAVTGIELRDRAAGEEGCCPSDTIECLPLGNRHLKLESVLLFDKTDRNDSLCERKTVPVYSRGRREEEGNLFHLFDYPHGDSLLLVKHSPTPSSALNRQSRDLLLEGNRCAVLLGSGVDFANMPEGRVPFYATAAGVGKTDQIWEEFWRYSTAFSQGDPRGALFVMSNTWGDRSQDMAVCEEFICRELEQAQKLGVDILQIDDGWETGVTANSRRRQGGVWEGYYSDDADFWQVDPERFPNGLEPVVQKAKACGVELGLWFSPDSSRDFANVERDIETLWGLYSRYGVRYFKLDGVKIRSKRAETRFLSLLETLTSRSGGDIRFNLDVTAEDRFGYLFQTQYGTLFVENRYTDFGNYYPHNTFKNLWRLAEVLPARRLQMEVLNPRRNPQNYAGMPFAPGLYRMDYLLGTVMPANPLIWMEMSHLSPEDAALLAAVSAVYRRHAAELFEARVIPVGDCPDGQSFSGYCCAGPDRRYAHLLLFREETAESAHRFQLPVSLDGGRMELLYQSAPVRLEPDGETILADFCEVRSFIWVKITY